MRADDEPPSPRLLIDAERRVHRILRGRFAEALAELAVSFAQLEVMELLHDEEKLHPGAIGRLLLITRQSADHLVRQLERRDLVDVWPNDGGTLGVRLTDEGRRLTALPFGPRANVGAPRYARRRDAETAPDRPEGL